ncbi:MAG: hypothetical protein FWC19_01645 [Treponema sp.]|nr:hypothetical protein [Treponema sp.]MCL2271496.1 hypothetical protein [Treponema sp.]
MVKFASVLGIEPFELFKPADALPSKVSSLLAKYNDDVICAVSDSLKQVYIYYQAKAEAKTETETETKKQIRKKKRR